MFDAETAATRLRERCEGEGGKGGAFVIGHATLVLALQAAHDAGVAKRPNRCGGRGYYLTAPVDPSDWDVDTVRVDCRGCVDCRSSKPNKEEP
jgi:hypothetical protein